jgi:hypothetical protein
MLFHEQECEHVCVNKGNKCARDANSPSLPWVRSSLLMGSVILITLVLSTLSNPGAEYGREGVV